MAKYILRTPKEKRSSIKMEIYALGGKYFYPTGLNIATKEWNAKAQRVRSTLSNSQEAQLANETLEKLESACKRTIAKFKASYTPPTVDEFRKVFDLEYKGKPTITKKKIPSFLEYMAIYIERYKASKSTNTTRSITTIHNKLKEYQKLKKTTLTFKSIDMMLYVDLSTWFAGQGYRDSYFATAIKVIKQVYREAREIDKLHNYNGIEARGFTSSSGDVDNIYLTTEELQRIHDTDITMELLKANYPNSRESDLERKKSSLLTARAFFLFAAKTGLRVSDMRRLKDAEISDGKIRIRTLKTNKEVVIPYGAMVREILSGDIDMTKPPSEQKLNDAIKELARLSGIVDRVVITRKIGTKLVSEHKGKWELVMTHTARRSFATNAYKAGVPTLGIMKITGHTKESTFLKYIKIGIEENADILAKHPHFD